MLFTIAAIQATLDYTMGQELSGDIIAVGNIITKQGGDVITKIDKRCIAIYKNDGTQINSELKGVTTSQFNLSKQKDDICIPINSGEIIKAYAFDITNQGNNDIVLIVQQTDQYDVYLVPQATKDDGHVYNLSGALYHQPVQILQNLPQKPNILFAPTNQAPYIAYITEDGVMIYYMSNASANLDGCLNTGQCYSAAQMLNLRQLFNGSNAKYENMILQSDFDTDCQPELQVVVRSWDILNRSQYDAFQLIFNQTGSKSGNYSYLVHFEFGTQSSALPLRFKTLSYLGKGEAAHFSLIDVNNTGRPGLMYLIDEHVCYLENIQVNDQQKSMEGVQRGVKAFQTFKPGQNNNNTPSFSTQIKRFIWKLTMQREMALLRGSEQSSSLISQEYMCTKTEFSLALIGAKALPAGANQTTLIFFSADLLMDLGSYAVFSVGTRLSALGFERINSDGNHLQETYLWNYTLACDSPQISVLDGNFNGLNSILVSCNNKTQIFHPNTTQQFFFIQFFTSRNGAQSGAKTNEWKGLGAIGAGSIRALVQGDIIIQRCQYCEVNMDRVISKRAAVPLGAKSAFVSRVGIGNVQKNAQYDAGVVPKAFITLEITGKSRFFMFLPENYFYTIIVSAVALGITLFFALITIILFAKEQKIDNFVRKQTRRRFA